MSSAPGWHSRGFMRHYDPGEVPQFITWRLDDSIPVDLYLKWKAEVARDKDGKSELYRRVEKYLDSGAGSCCRREPTRAKIVSEAIHFHAGSRFELHAYVIMPNHVHTVLTPKQGLKLGAIIGSIKGYSAHEINRVFGSSGRLWQVEYYDRMIRTAEQLRRTVAYVEWNPVKAKLCVDPKSWVFSSAHQAA